MVEVAVSLPVGPLHDDLHTRSADQIRPRPVRHGSRRHPWLDDRPCADDELLRPSASTPSGRWCPQPRPAATTARLSRAPLVFWDRVKILVSPIAMFRAHLAQLASNLLGDAGRGRAHRWRSPASARSCSVLVVSGGVLPDPLPARGARSRPPPEMRLRLARADREAHRPLERLDALPRRRREAAGWPAIVAMVFSWPSPACRRSSRCSRCPPGSIQQLPMIIQLVLYLFHRSPSFPH